MAKPPDWTKTGTVAGYAEWIRGKAEALCVIVIRRDDSVLAADDALPAADVRTLVEGHVPGLTENLLAARAGKKKAARLELGPLGE